MSILAKEEEGRNHILSAIFALIVLIPLGQWLAPDLIGGSILRVWDDHGTYPDDWFVLGLPLFAWGVGITIVFKILGVTGPKPKSKEKVTRAGILGGGFLISLQAGVVEELTFRWLIYYGAFITLAVVNFLLGGFLGGAGLPEWFYLNLFGPIADFVTFNSLGNVINDPRTWLTGGAMLSANAFFRDGHSYQGLFGMINSWFVGMFLFYTMFNMGLMAAMVVHFTYDMLIFTVAAAMHRE